jgi:hypothetical protein
MTDTDTTTGEVLIKGEAVPANGGDILFNMWSMDQGPEDLSNTLEKLQIGLEKAAQVEGDIILTTGKGYKDAPHGSIIFQIGGNEIFRLNHDGDFIHRGKVVATDKELFLLFRGYTAYMMLALNATPHRDPDLPIEESSHDGTHPVGS